MFSYLDSRDKTAVMAKRMKYFTNRGKESQVSFCFGFTQFQIYLFHIQ